MARGRIRARKRRGSKQKGEGLSLKATSLISIVVFIIILAVAIFWAQLMPLQKLQKSSDIELESTDARLANTLALKVASFTEVARGVARDPQTRQLLLSGDEIAIGARERELAQLFPWLIRVRLLPTGIRSPDKSSKPHISFACLDMLSEAETKLQAPPVEVHVINTPQQHIEIIQPIPSTNGKAAVGHLQVTLQVEVLKQWLTSLQPEGYLSLTQSVENQPTTLLAETGDKSAISSGRVVELPVAGTRWHLNLWLPGDISIGLFNTNFILTFVVGALMSFLLVMLVLRSLSRAISNDVESFMQLMVEELRDHKQHQHYFRLEEFEAGARKVGNLAASQTMERERDSNVAAMTMKDLQLDPDMETIKDDELLSVEELSDSSAFEESLRRQAETKSAKDLQQPVNKPQTAAVTPKPAAAAPPALPPAEIFKAYDIRGIVGRTLTAQHMQLIGQALGSEAASRGLTSIAFARDGRLSGPELGQALVKGLLATGINVIDVGMVPTPVLYFAAAELAGGSGAMLTGSHNPSDYNGIKMVLGDETLAGDSIQALKTRIDNKDFIEGSGQYQTNPLSNQYIERIAADIKLARGLKVVIDSGNGVAGGLAPKLYRTLGCEVVELYSEVDGRFPNHHPDPSQPGNLRDLIEMVRSTNADIGLAFDGDGDRLGVVSPDGSVIWPDRLMMLFATDVLSRNPSAQIIFDIKCSNNLTRAIWEKGGEPVMWKTGHSLIKAKMKQSGALLAGEMSGHIFFKERWYGFDDALYAGARLLEIIAADSRNSQQIFASLPDAENTPELRVDMQEGEQQRFMDELMSRADFPDANVIMIDGIRADFENGWGLVRASNTTPSLILRFEGQDKQALAEIQEKFRAMMLEVDPNLQLPF
ncbi:MAG: phosphomannomutase/phosphoglucomutase [Gammaproteobacteria bacterium]|nr:phosphomannomutase/phosphoglucomutase [Gammaproteobacteria bacterium]